MSFRHATAIPSQYPIKEYRVWVMVFKATFNNISAISWRSILLLLPGENHRPVVRHC